MKLKNIAVGLVLGMMISVSMSFAMNSPTIARASEPSTVLLAQGSDSQVVSEATSKGFVPCGDERGNPCTIAHLFAGFVVIINYLIASSGFVAIAMIIYAGLRMVLARGNESELTAAKGRLTGAITGVVLVSIAFVLINSFLSGSFSLGVKDGGLILTNPRQYIQNAGSSAPSPSKTPGTSTTPGKGGTTTGTSSTPKPPSTTTGGSTSTTTTGTIKFNYICINRETGVIDKVDTSGKCKDPLVPTTGISKPTFCVFNEPTSDGKKRFRPISVSSTATEADCKKMLEGTGPFQISKYQP